MKNKTCQSQSGDLTITERPDLSPDSFLTHAARALTGSVQDYLLATIAAQECPNGPNLLMVSRQLDDLAVTASVCIEATRSWIDSLVSEEEITQT